MDSSATKNRLRELIGSVGYALLRRKLRNVKLKIDVEQRHVLVTKDGEVHKITFDEIEQVINEPV